MIRDDDVFRCLGLASLPLGSSRVFAYSEASGEARVLDSTSGQLLPFCGSYRTLAGHAREICRREGWDATIESSVRNELARLAAEGFLVSRRSILAGSSGPRPPRLETLVVLTRNRPRLMARCLDSYLANARESGRSPGILVLNDGDAEPSGAADAVAAAGSRFGCRTTWVGRREVQRFIDELARGGAVDPELLRFAMLDRGGKAVAPGQNRNRALLMLAGTPFVSVDDDTVGSVAPAPEADPGRILYRSDVDPTEFWFGEEAPKGGPSESRDFLALHEEMLGRGALDCARGRAEAAVDLDPLDGILASWIKEGQGRVRLTLAGLRGDCGMSSPAWFLALRGGSRGRFAGSTELYERFRLGRRVTRAARSLTIGEGGFFMAYAAGFDNRELLPPFPPFFRAEDDVFAFMLRRCSGRDVAGYLPWTVLHEPGEPRAFTPEDLWDGGIRAGFADVLRACLDAVPLQKSWDPRRCLRTMGQHLQEFGKATRAEFLWLLRSALWPRASRWLTTLQERLDEFPEGPARWAEDLRQALDRGARALPSEEFVVPRDISGPDVDARLAETQVLVERIGRLLSAWPDLVERAAELRRRDLP
jgi:hypothetical protein